jgi:uncharacterized RDD family membrane protein YckC
VPVGPELDETLSARGAGAPIASGDGGLPAGLRLGHFRIDKRLGAGGMGEVYLATDLALDRPVAVKVLPAASASGTARDRLVREARAQARVHHPNVGHIYFIGEEGDRLYFAMEYLSGGTLADRLARGPLQAEEALEMIRAAALGLREAQRSGFLHRDVKPSNLMVDGHGTLKVTDFGLAAGGANDRAADGPVAQTTLAGTPLYMAPEQARGDAIDLRADIYALGATLYHLVSGKPPFQAQTVEELLTLHRSGDRPHVPRKGHARTAVAAIDSLVARMMAPDPASRFASYDELLRALEQASARHTRPGGFWVRGIAALVDLTLLSIVLGLAAWVLSQFFSVEVDSSAMISFIAVFQALSIAAWGATPGKALFELEVVAIDTDRKPRLRTALLRSTIEFGPPIMFEWLSFLTDYFGWANNPTHFVVRLLAAAAYLLVFVTLLHAALRVPGKRAPWDRLSGTMVRYRTSRARAT